MTRYVSIQQRTLAWLRLFGFSIDLSWWKYGTGMKFLRYDPITLTAFVFAVYVARMDGSGSRKFEVKPRWI